MKTKKKNIRLIQLLASVLMLGGALFLVGCETTAGAGRDLEAAGDAIEGAAEDAQGY